MSGRRPSPTRPGTSDVAPAFEAGAKLFLVSLHDLAVGASVSTANLGVRTIELGDLTVIGRLRRVEAQQSSRNALGAGRGNRSSGHQSNESNGTGQYEGLLEKIRHDAFSFGLDWTRHATAGEVSKTVPVSITKVTGHIKLRVSNSLIPLRRTLFNMTGQLRMSTDTNGR